MDETREELSFYKLQATSKLKVWNITDGRELLSKVFEGPVASLDFSPDEETLALVVEASNKAQLWKFRTSS